MILQELPAVLDFHLLDVLRESGDRVRSAVYADELDRPVGTEMSFNHVGDPGGGVFTVWVVEHRHLDTVLLTPR